MNFTLHPAGPVAQRFMQLGIADFTAAMHYVQNLPYRRNTVKDNACVALDEQCGTCSTKHAALAALAQEHKTAGVQLMLGMFNMHARNTPRVAAVLAKYNLSHIPEAHNYLRIHGAIADCTMPGKPLDFVNDLVAETAIQPGDISTFKVNYHRGFLQQWITRENIPHDLDKVWAIREECIAALSL